MNVTSDNRSGKQQPHWGWMALLAALLAVNLGAIGKAGFVNLQATTLLFSLGVAWRLHQRAIPLQLTRDRLSQGIGILILVCALVISIQPDRAGWVRFLPVISALGIATLAAGIRNLKHYRQDLLLFLVLAMPLEQWVAPLDRWLGIGTRMAQLAHFLLWYVGFNVSRQGDIILLPTGSTWVGANCAGTLTILWMLQLSVLVLTLFPMSWFKKVLIPLGAVAIVVGCNGIRIAIMTLLATHNLAAFQYWHSNQGQFLSTIPILLFAWFCSWLLRSNQSPRSSSEPMAQDSRYIDD